MPDESAATTNARPDDRIWQIDGAWQRCWRYRTSNSPRSGSVVFSQPTGGIQCKVGEHTIGAGTLERQQRFQRTAALVEPAIGCRSEEHTSELQSLMRISYAVFCLKKKKIKTHNTTNQLEIATQLT